MIEPMRRFSCPTCRALHGSRFSDEMRRLTGRQGLLARFPSPMPDRRQPKPRAKPAPSHKRHRARRYTAPPRAHRSRQSPQSQAPAPRGRRPASQRPNLPRRRFPPTLPRSANSRSRPSRCGAAPHTRCLRAGSVRADGPCTGHRCRVLSLLVALLELILSRPGRGLGFESASLPPSRPPEESPSWQPLTPPGRAGASRV
jgi:hypothetical protein